VKTIVGSDLDVGSTHCCNTSHSIGKALRVQPKLKRTPYSLSLDRLFACGPYGVHSMVFGPSKLGGPKGAHQDQARLFPTSGPFLSDEQMVVELLSITRNGADPKPRALMHSEDFVQLAQPSSAWREALTRAWYYIRGQYSESSEEDHCSTKNATRMGCADVFVLWPVCLSILSQLRSFGALMRRGSGIEGQLPTAPRAAASPLTIVKPPLSS
jgi:hypothetical protein